MIAPSTTTTDHLRTDQDAFRLNAMQHLYQRARAGGASIEAAQAETDALANWLRTMERRA